MIYNVSRRTITMKLLSRMKNRVGRFRVLYTVSWIKSRCVQVNPVFRLYKLYYYFKSFALVIDLWCIIITRPFTELIIIAALFFLCLSCYSVIDVKVQEIAEDYDYYLYYASARTKWVITWFISSDYQRLPYRETRDERHNRRRQFELMPTMRSIWYFPFELNYNHRVSRCYSRLYRNYRVRRTIKSRHLDFIHGESGSYIRASRCRCRWYSTQVDSARHAAPREKRPS